MIKVGDRIKILGVDKSPAISSMKRFIGQVGVVIRLTPNPCVNFDPLNELDWTFNIDEVEVVKPMTLETFGRRAQKVVIRMLALPQKSVAKNDMIVARECVSHPNKYMNASSMRMLNNLYHKYNKRK